MTNKCKDCGKRISLKAQRCHSCAKKGKNNSNYKHGKSNNNKCIDCGKHIKLTSTRCKKCANFNRRGKYTGKLSSSFTNGKWLKVNCIDCGKKINPNCKRCKSCENKRRYKNSSNHWNWQGGKSTLAMMIKNLEKYPIWRNQVFQRDNYTCQECEQYGGKLEAHHKKEFHIILAEFLKEYNQFSPIEDKETLVRLAIKWKPFWDINNGIILCEDCHMKKHKELNFKRK